MHLLRPTLLLSLSACTLFLLPAVANADAPRTFIELASYLVFIMNNAISVVIILALVIYFWGIFTTIPEKKGGDSEQRRNVLLFGLIGLFIMVSVWGILRLLQETIFSSDGGGIGVGAEQSGSFCETFGSCE